MNSGDRCVNTLSLKLKNWLCMVFFREVLQQHRHFPVCLCRFFLLFTRLQGCEKNEKVSSAKKDSARKT